MRDDNRGRGPDDEGRIERGPKRPYENNPVKDQQDKTKKRAGEALNKKGK